MPAQAYAVYCSTFQSARDALRTGDEERLRQMCREVASRSGISSTVSLMAVSDAECGRPARTRAVVRALFWGHGGLDDAECDAAPDSMGEAGAPSKAA